DCKDARMLDTFICMILVIPAGTGGINNASNQMNQVVHNKILVTCHFHLTAAATVILTFFGITYWLIPSITGRKLTAKMNKLGIVQTIFWSVGITIMSVAMHWQ